MEPTREAITDGHEQDNILIEYDLGLIDPAVAAAKAKIDELNAQLSLLKKTQLPDSSECRAIKQKIAKEEKELRELQTATGVRLFERNGATGTDFDGDGSIDVNLDEDNGSSYSEKIDAILADIATEATNGAATVNNAEPEPINLRLIEDTYGKFKDALNNLQDFWGDSAASAMEITPIVRDALVNKCRDICSRAKDIYGKAIDIERENRRPETAMHLASVLARYDSIVSVISETVDYEQLNWLLAAEIGALEESFTQYKESCMTEEPSKISAAETRQIRIEIRTCYEAFFPIVDELLIAYEEAARTPTDKVLDYISSLVANLEKAEAQLEDLLIFHADNMGDDWNESLELLAINVLFHAQESIKRCKQPEGVGKNSRHTMFRATRGLLVTEKSQFERCFDLFMKALLEYHKRIEY